MTMTNDTTPLPQTQQSPGALPGFNCLLQGDAGTGKTTSVHTLVETGLEVFYLACEPGMESLIGWWADKGKPVPDNLHWHYLAPPKSNFSNLIQGAKDVNTQTYEMLTKKQDPKRSEHNYFVKLLECLNGFVDQRTGESFGSVDEWDTSRVLVIDPMTGINRAAMDLVVGNKPVKSPSDWGIAQDQVERLVRMLTDGCRCHFVMLAHVEKELDPILGGMRITVSTLGKALAPKIVPMFSDVVYAYRDGRDFLWSTLNSNAIVKNRNLRMDDKLPPSFGPMVDTWRKRNQSASA